MFNLFLKIPVDFHAAFLYKETPTAGHGKKKRVSQGFKHENRIRKNGVLAVAGSL